MRIEDQEVKVAFGEVCFATEEDYMASEYGDRQEYDPVREKTFYQIGVTTEDGRVFKHSHVFALQDYDKAEALANKINSTDREWDKYCWDFERYIYGSVAFQKNEREANYMMMDEEEKAYHYG